MIAILIAVAMCAMVLGNMLPSFAMPTLKALNTTDRGESLRLARAKARVRKNEWEFSDTEKRYMESCARGEEEFDVKRISCPDDWYDGKYETATAHEIARVQYGKKVDLSKLSVTEQNKLFECFLDKMMKYATDHVSVNTGLDYTFDSYRKSKRYALTGLNEKPLSEIESWEKQCLEIAD